MNPSLLLVFLFAALTVYALFRVVAPFLDPREDQLRHELLDEEMQQIERLVARKSVLLQSLRDVEFDHETGKLSDEDYQRLQTQYEREAIEVMRKLDEVRGGVDLDSEIDDQLRARLEERVVETEEQSEPASEEETADADRIECPECGKDLEAAARFCSRCGFAIAGADSGSSGSDGTGSGTTEEADGDETAGEVEGDREPEEVESRTGAETDEAVGGELRSEPTG